MRFLAPPRQWLLKLAFLKIKPWVYKDMGSLVFASTSARLSLQGCIRMYIEIEFVVFTTTSLCA
jgi:hypothetical protein